MKLSDLTDKKVLILGLGREGTDTYFFLRKLFLKKVLGLADQLTFEKLSPAIQKVLKTDHKLKLHLGTNYLGDLKQYEVIVKSPGISPFLSEFKKLKNQQITSQTKLFFDNCPGVIVGVTGTKGKSTTATLIYEILKKGGLPTKLVGNIEKPVLSLLGGANQKTIFVYELSSHQLWGLTKSPHVAVLLNIFQEHLDYYPNFDTYVRAKENITLHQTANDYLIFNAALPILRKIAAKSRAQKIPYDLKKDKEDLEKIILLKEIPLKGEFNLQNVIPAVIVGKIFHLSNEKIAQGIRSFKPLEHRLEQIGIYRGITFYDDSIATIPEATIEAIDTLGDRLQTILLGGFERQQDFQNLGKKILQNKIRNVILFPTTGKRIWQAIVDQKDKQNLLPQHFSVNSMKEAIKLVYQHTQKGKICLLSSASPSFGLFRDYKERGDLFKKFARNLK